LSLTVVLLLPNDEIDNKAFRSLIFIDFNHCEARICTVMDSESRLSGSRLQFKEEIRIPVPWGHFAGKNYNLYN